MDKETLLKETERRLMRICEEIAHLNTKKSDLVSRYYKAMMDNNHSVIPSLKYRITTDCRRNQATVRLLCQLQRPEFGRFMEMHGSRVPCQDPEFDGDN
jgi:hypothetical protein